MSDRLRVRCAGGFVSRWASSWSRPPVRFPQPRLWPVLSGSSSSAWAIVRRPFADGRGSLSTPFAPRPHGGRHATGSRTVGLGDRRLGSFGAPGLGPTRAGGAHELEGISGRLTRNPGEPGMGDLRNRANLFALVAHGSPQHALWIIRRAWSARASRTCQPARRLVIATHYRASTLRPAQPRLLADKALTDAVFRAEYAASKTDPTAIRLVEAGHGLHKRIDACKAG